jgi:hypothetical protein
MLILECCSPHKAAKKFCCLPDGRWDKLSDYDAGTWFSVDQWEPKSLNDIADLVAVLRPLRTHYVVRGRLNAVGRALVSAGRRIRRCHTTDTVPDPPIDDCPQNWVMADVDSYVVPSGMALGSATLIRHVIYDLLPVEFHDVACVWTLSSSCGLTTRLLKCHLWFWLAGAITSEVMRRTLRQRSRVDAGVCTPSQPHYTADPILSGGDDPFAHCRAGVLAGRPQVEHLQTSEPELPRCRLIARSPALTTVPDGEVLIPQHLVTGALARPKGDGRRLWTLLYSAAARAVEHGWDITDDDLARAAQQAHSIFDRCGLLREARRALDRAKARVAPRDPLEQQRSKLRWQLSQPLNKE